MPLTFSQLLGLAPPAELDLSFSGLSGYKKSSTGTGKSTIDLKGLEVGDSIDIIPFYESGLPTYHSKIKMDIINDIQNAALIASSAMNTDDPELKFKATKNFYEKRHRGEAILNILEQNEKVIEEFNEKMKTGVLRETAWSAYDKSNEYSEAMKEFYEGQRLDVPVLRPLADLVPENIDLVEKINSALSGIKSYEDATLKGNIKGSKMTLPSGREVDMVSYLTNVITPQRVDKIITALSEDPIVSNYIVNLAMGRAKKRQYIKMLGYSPDDPRTLEPIDDDKLVEMASEEKDNILDTMREIAYKAVSSDIEYEFFIEPEGVTSGRLEYEKLVEAPIVPVGVLPYELGEFSLLPAVMQRAFKEPGDIRRIDEIPSVTGLLKEINEGRTGHEGKWMRMFKVALNHFRKDPEKKITLEQLIDTDKIPGLKNVATKMKASGIDVNESNIDRYYNYYIFRSNLTSDIWGKTLSPSLQSDIGKMFLTKFKGVTAGGTIASTPVYGIDYSKGKVIEPAKGSRNFDKVLSELNIGIEDIRKPSRILYPNEIMDGGIEFVIDNNKSIVVSPEAINEKAKETAEDIRNISSQVEGIEINIDNEGNEIPGKVGKYRNYEIIPFNNWDGAVYLGRDALIVTKDSSGNEIKMRWSEYKRYLEYKFYSEIMVGLGRKPLGYRTSAFGPVNPPRISK